MEFFCKSNSIHMILTVQTTTDAVDVANSSLDKLAISENFISIITSLILAIAGVIGISYLNKIKEKRYNATFSFCARLKIRLHIIKNIMDEHKNFMLDQLIPLNFREKVDISLESITKKAKIKMCNTATETIEFLKDTEDQMPAAEGWSNKCSVLFEFLEDYSRLSDEFDHLKWTDNYEEEKSNYYNKHYTNITSMLNDIEKQQEEIECKMFNPWFIVLFKTISKRAKKK